MHERIKPNTYILWVQRLSLALLQSANLKSGVIRQRKMWRLFHAGFVAASAQILAVAAATVAVTIALRCGLVIPASGAAESELQSAVRLLRWIDLFLAVGVALTRNRFIDETAERIREAARRFYPPAPDHACKALFVQLCAASAGLAVLALRPPPGFLIAAADTWGWGPAVMLIWPGVMSVGVAAFGANAHAAGRAF
jgi:hypothetical protein